MSTDSNLNMGGDKTYGQQWMEKWGNDYDVLNIPYSIQCPPFVSEDYQWEHKAE